MKMIGHPHYSPNLIMCDFKLSFNLGVVLIPKIRLMRLYKHIFHLLRNGWLEAINIWKIRLQKGINIVRTTLNISKRW